VSVYQMFKYVVVWLTGLAMDALHIYVGLIVWLAVAMVFKRRLGSWLPWAAVLAAACAGEALDFFDDLRTLGYWDWRASVHDIWNTLFWPTAFTILARSGILGRLLDGPRSADREVTAEPRETREG
jgi:hypothetical protein